MPPIVIAQISDLHLGFAHGGADEPNRRRLDAVVARLAQITPQPDHVIVSGDLTEFGEASAYAAVREALAPLPSPVSVMTGNHDRRAPFFAAFQNPPAGRFAQSVLDVGGLRVLTLDTLEEGRHGGGFCPERSTWLSQRLGEAPTTPTLVFLHHPPLPLGIGWMDPTPGACWITRLASALDGHAQVLALACGHLHRPIATRWRGFPLVVCPSTSPELALELAPIDPAVADDRPLIVSGAPGYALHRWDGTAMTHHFGFVGGETVARFTPNLQPMIAAMAAERRPASAVQQRDQPGKVGEQE